MPIGFTIDPRRRLVVTRYHGALTAHDAVEWTDRVTADPRFDPTYDHLCSFEDVTGTTLDGAGVRLASDLSPFVQAARRAFIVRSELLYGLGRMFQLVGDESPESHQLFGDVESALHWLAQDAGAAALLDQLRSPTAT